MGPVNLQLKPLEDVNQQSKEGAVQQPPVLRLFMHHQCCIGLEQFLVEQSGGDPSTVDQHSKSASMGSFPMPKARKLLRDAREYEKALSGLIHPGAESKRNWKSSRGGQNVTQVEQRGFSSAREPGTTLKAGEYLI